MADLKEAITKKYGPLPLWGWGVVGIGGFVVWRAMSGGDGEQTLVPYPSGALGNIGSGGSGGGGGGGGGGSTPPPSTDPPDTTPPPDTGGGTPQLPNWLDWFRDWFGQLPPLPQPGTPGTPGTGTPIPGSPGGQTPTTGGGGTTTPDWWGVFIPGAPSNPTSAAQIESGWRAVAARALSGEFGWQPFGDFITGNAAPERTIPAPMYAGLQLGGTLTPAQAASVRYDTPEFAEFLAGAGTELPHYSLNTLTNYWQSGGYAGSQSDLEGAIVTNVQQLITNNEALGISAADTVRNLPPSTRAAYETITGAPSSTGLAPTPGNPTLGTVQMSMNGISPIGSPAIVPQGIPTIPTAMPSNSGAPLSSTQTIIPAPAVSIPADWNIGLVSGGATIQPMPTPAYAPSVPTYSGGWIDTLNGTLNRWLSRNRSN